MCTSHASIDGIESVRQQLQPTGVPRAGRVLGPPGAQRPGSPPHARPLTLWATRRGSSWCSCDARPGNCAVYSRCMAATRTQVYLTADQRRMIDEVAKAEGV